MSGSPGLDAGLAAALASLAQAERPLVALDFDGTLAPLVDDRDAARALPGSAQAVRDLAALGGRARLDVALVSGRSLADLVRLADPPSTVHLVGSHGAQVRRAAGPGEDEGTRLDALDDAARVLLADVVDRLGVVVADHPGSDLETKPTGAVLHTRRADVAVAAAAVRAAVDGPGRLPGVRVLRGKDVVELSVVDVDKGRALTALRSALGSGPALYAGDDVTDEHAFGVLDADAGDVGVKVGADESAALFRVAGPPEVTALLEELLAARRAR